MIDGVDRIAKQSRMTMWMPMAAILMGAVGLVWLLVSDCDATLATGFYSQLPAGFGFSLLGALIAYFRPENRIGRLCLLIGFLEVFGLTFADLYARCGLSGGLSLPGAAYAAWLRFLILPGMLACMAILLPHWFPDGRFLSSRWKALGLGSLIVLGLFTLPAALLPGTLENTIYRFSYPVENPLGLLTLPEWLGSLVYPYVNLPLIAGIIIAVLSLVVRWRRSDSVARQQIKWIVYFLVMLVVVQVVAIELIAGIFYRGIFGSVFYAILSAITFAGLPVVVGAAIFRYRLYDIDLIIRRTLVYSVLTALFAAVYFGSVILLQFLFSAASGQHSATSIVISTLFIAALFNPVRGRVQTIVDRRFYRHKYDAAHTLSRFAKMARDEVELEALEKGLVQAVTETMQPAQVSIWLRTISGAQISDEGRMESDQKQKGDFRNV